MWATLLTAIQQGDQRSLARAISLVENGAPGFEQLMEALPPSNRPLIGITGAPGAGKSTLVDALVQQFIGENKKIAVLCIDPSSPFHHGAVLGDRIRMSQWYNHPSVYIRSLASRGSLGGLHPRIIEICEIIKCAPIDFIMIETVGVGQSEVEIAGLADCTIVVTVPEGGDEIQTMKAGIMEIADLFVVNKADRPGADLFVHTLQHMLASAGEVPIPILKTISTEKKGIEELFSNILSILGKQRNMNRKAWLLMERAYRIIQERRMKDIDKNDLLQTIYKRLPSQAINLYQLVKAYD